VILWVKWPPFFFFSKKNQNFLFDLQLFNNLLNIP
jgi:hypothetical protein